MFDYVAAEPLEVLRSCRCCLRQSAERNLKTPYTYDGKMEIYMDMLKDSLDIHLDLDSNDCGICGTCVGRLQDASDFKRQVQRSQAEMRARLERAERIGEETVVKSEFDDDCDDFMLYYADEEPLNNSYLIEDSDEDSVSPLKDLPDTPPLSARSLPAAAVKQLAMSCAVSLERVEVARVPHPCHTCHRIFLEPSGLETHGKDDSCNGYTCDTCGRQFKRKSSFAKHVQTHMTRQSGVNSKNISDRKEGSRINSKIISDQKESCKRIRSKKISDHKVASNRITSKTISDRKRVNKDMTHKRSLKLIKYTSRTCGKNA